MVWFKVMHCTLVTLHIMWSWREQYSLLQGLTNCSITNYCNLAHDVINGHDDTFGNAWQGDTSVTQSFIRSVSQRASQRHFRNIHWNAHWQDAFASFGFLTLDYKNMFSIFADPRNFYFIIFINILIKIN